MVALNIRARSSRLLSLRRCRFQLLNFPPNRFRRLVADRRAETHRRIRPTRSSTAGAGTCSPESRRMLRGTSLADRCPGSRQSSSSPGAAQARIPQSDASERPADGVPAARCDNGRRYRRHSARTGWSGSVVPSTNRTHNAGTDWQAADLRHPLGACLDPALPPRRPGSIVGAFSHRSIYNTTHFSSV